MRTARPVAIIPGTVAMLACFGCAAPTGARPPPMGAKNDAAPEVRAGDARLDGSFLAPYESQWTIRVTLADGRPREDATWTDRLEWIEAGGRHFLRRTQHESENLADEEVHPGLAKKLGTDRLELTMANDFDPRTLAPIETTVSTNVGRTMHLRFDGARVTAEKTGWQAAPIPIDDRLDAAPFDIQDGMYGYLAVASPFEGGFHARFAEYRAPRGLEATGALGWLDVRDEGAARIAAGSFGVRDARVFSVADADGGSFRFWVSREAPYVLRVVQSEPAAGQTWTFELR